MARPSPRSRASSTRSCRAPLREAVAASAQAFEAAGVPAALARRIAQLPRLRDATDIHLVAEQAGAPLERAARVFFAIADRLGTSRIVAAARRVPVADRFDRLALDRALDMLADARRRIATEALLAEQEAADPLGAWIGKRARAVERAFATFTGEAAEPSVARVTVAANLLADLARGEPLTPGRPGGTPPSFRALAGWVLFDWAAQPFFTLVTTFVFAPYFAARIAATTVEGQALWGYATAAAGLTIALLSPVLGAIADAAGRAQAVDRGLLGDARRRLGGALVRRTGASRRRDRASSPSPSAPSAPNSPPSSTTP